MKKISEEEIEAEHRRSRRDVHQSETERAVCIHCGISFDPSQAVAGEDGLCDGCNSGD